MAMGLIVDSNRETARAAARALESAGHEIRLSESLARARAAMETERFDFLILPEKSADGDGAALCRAVTKARAAARPKTFLLTDLPSFRARATGNAVTADVFLCRPLLPEALADSVRAALSSPSARPKRPFPFQWGPFSLTPARRQVRMNGRPLPRLSAVQFRLFYSLASHGGSPLSRSWFLYRLWRRPVKDSQVAVTVARLRKRLGPEAGGRIISLPGRGYALLLDDAAPPSRN